MTHALKRNGYGRLALAAAALLTAIFALVISSPTLEAQSSPGTPDSVTVYRGADFLDVEWPAISGATGYNVVYSGDHKNSWHRAVTDHPQNGYSIPNIPNNKTYYVAVQATNAHGGGGWRNSDANHPATKPDPALEIKVIRDNGKLVVYWFQCDYDTLICIDDGGSPRTHHYVNMSADNGQSWTRVKTFTDGLDHGRSDTTIDSGISNANSYLVAVGIQNRVGVSWANEPVPPWPSPGSRDSANDFDTVSSVGPNVFDIWSDGTTVWRLESRDNKLYAFNLATKARDSGKDIALDSDNNSNRTTSSRPFTSDGTTMWVMETDGKVEAYTLATGARDSSKDITLQSEVTWPLRTAMWTNGATIWVLEIWGGDDRAYAYTVATGERESDKDIRLHDDNRIAVGLWSDGATMWVVDYGDYVYAYRMSDGSRDPAKDYANLDFINAGPAGIWSDGTTTWVSDQISDKLFAYYSMDPLTQPATPASVTVHRGANFLDVEWPAVSRAASYDVVYSGDHRASWTRAATGHFHTNLRIPNVPNNKTYYVAVRANNLKGSSGWRNSPPNHQASAPAPAQNIQVTRGDGEIRVSWTQCDATQSSCNGGSPIIHYAVNLSGDGGASWTRAKTLTGYTSGDTVTVTSGVVNETSYLVAVGIENRVATKWTNVSVGPLTP